MVLSPILLIYTALLFLFLFGTGAWNGRNIDRNIQVLSLLRKLLRALIVPTDPVRYLVLCHHTQPVIIMTIVVVQRIMLIVQNKGTTCRIFWDFFDGAVVLRDWKLAWQMSFYLFWVLLDRFLFQAALTAKSWVWVLGSVNRLDFDWHIYMIWSFFCGSHFLLLLIWGILLVICGFLEWSLLIVLENLKLRRVRYDIEIVMGPRWLRLIDYEWWLNSVCMRARDVLKRINLGA